METCTSSSCLMKEKEKCQNQKCPQSALLQSLFLFSVDHRSQSPIVNRNKRQTTNLSFCFSNIHSTKKAMTLATHSSTCITSISVKKAHAEKIVQVSQPRMKPSSSSSISKSSKKSKAKSEVFTTEHEEETLQVSEPRMMPSSSSNISKSSKKSKVKSEIFTTVSTHVSISITTNPTTAATAPAKGE